jgi:DNA-binding beta-propeller fold protein YncE
MWRVRCLIALLIAIVGTGAAIPSSAGATARTTILARGFGEPDDLAWGPHSSIYFVDFGNSALNVLLPNGRRQVLVGHLQEPEGIVVRRDGTLIVAEQGTNQLLHVDLARHTNSVVLTIPNPTSRSGIDGIALDPRDGSIVVPDSPSGRVFRVSLSGRATLTAHATLLARGLGRPVGALVQHDGGIIVVDETLNGAFHIDRAGTIRQIGGYLSVPDDVVDDGHGGFYVTCLGDGTVRHVDRAGHTTLVAANIPNPQGLLRRADGTLIVTEEQANLILAIAP